MQLCERVVITDTTSRHSHGQTWHNRDDTRLVGLWYHVDAVNSIAAMLGRTAAAVYERASKIGLPPRREYLIEAVSFPVQLESGRCKRRIVLRKPCAHKAYTSAADPAATRRRVKGQAYRRCLSCGRQFASSWIGNRMCASCLTASATML